MVMVESLGSIRNRRLFWAAITNLSSSCWPLKWYFLYLWMTRKERSCF